MTSLDKAKLWLGEGFDDETKKEVQALIDNNPAELDDSFYKIWNSEQEVCAELWALVPIV
jgi:hypothetical protein